MNEKELISLIITNIEPKDFNNFLFDLKSARWGEKTASLQENILERYDNEEYWDSNLLEEYDLNKKQSEILRKINVNPVIKIPIDYFVSEGRIIINSEKIEDELLKQLEELKK